MVSENTYIHSKALVESDAIGEGTRIWAFAHVLKGAVIGKGCNVSDHCYIEGGVRIGDDVVIKNGVSIWEGVTIENRVFVGPNVSFTNDRVPRAKVFRDDYDELLVKVGASIGANSTIIAPLVIGRFAMIGAGAVVVKDVPDFGLVYGNPAGIKGWVCECGERLVQRTEDRGQRSDTDKLECVCRRVYRREGEKVRREEVEKVRRLEEQKSREKRPETGDDRLVCPACGLRYIKDGPQITQINAD